MSVELALLNHVIAKRDLSVLARNGLDDDSAFPEHADALRFIRKHVEQYGETPSLESVIRACPSFEPWDVGESPETLCAKLHERNTKLSIRRVLEEVAGEKGKFVRLDGYELLDFLGERLEQVRQDVSARRGSGATNWSRQTDQRRQEYDRRASGEYGTRIPLFWPKIEDAVGGFYRGDYVNLIAWTKKGKSWIGSVAGLTANRAGYRVLALLAESTKAEATFRLDTLEFGISNRGLFGGSLDSEQYQTYVRKLNELQEQNRPDYIIRTPEDWRHGLTLRQIEADIDQYKPDVVIIDQFSLINYGGHTWEAKEAASKQLKLLFARKGVVGVVITQASGDYGKRTHKHEDDEDDVQELRPPSESDYSGTIATIQDATHVLAFDSIQNRDEDGKERGKAQLVVRISRTGGAGTTVDLKWLPNDGIIEPRTAMDAF